jgi:hypothetical protein
MLIATHPLIGHDLPYRPMHGDWHGLVNMAGKTTFAQAAMQGHWALPLSLVQNIKIYFINDTHYFRMRFYINIKLC